jgi:signal peptidase I
MDTFGPHPAPPAHALLKLARTLVGFGWRWGARLLGLLTVLTLLGYGSLLVLQLDPFTMLTPSMQKTIPVGSLVIDRTVPSASLEIGDVISFQKPIGAKGLDTHRIVRVMRSNGHTSYRTKGDSNPIADPWTIEFPPGQSAHRVVLTIPYLGRALLDLKTPTARILIIGSVLVWLLSSFLKFLAASGTGKPKAAGDDNLTV